MYEKLKQRWQFEQTQRQLRAAARKDALLTYGIPVLKQFGIQKAVLFGSVLDNRSHKHSDIDLLVIPLESAVFWDFRRTLEQAVQYPVDVYTQSDDPIFVAKILQRGEIVYEKC